MSIQQKLKSIIIMMIKVMMKITKCKQLPKMLLSMLSFSSHLALKYGSHLDWKVNGSPRTIASLSTPDV